MLVSGEQAYVGREEQYDSPKNACVRGYFTSRYSSATRHKKFTSN